mmetsp:Transcript_94965/g.188105  ORF Transcript_94965/g.188105 Transcript_94965/m.188105 type:complete len:442 (-) Transcript_94965:271-1596(-)|eukprot:CAMPEP_0172716742 /NCGR_PEP_ID=MMETSP1074-20121228/69326_1 /TAXON_ID=2916 /ORGANISM="Ceratium fusus, Strain PA161109" /LENGTH=441 /DNA_ID=CAMNT_0013541519 /DNA_START=70 /DNA_END=1395 /DNA_ORIENTATION=+
MVTDVRDVQRDLLERDGSEHVAVNRLHDKDEILRRMQIQLQDLEFKGQLAFETDSVYGAVVAMPQIARCMGWNQTFLALCFRSFLLLALNYVFQVSALIFISEESQVMDVLGGKMHLCDYGKQLDDCKDWEDHPGCVGPGGTVFKPPRLYSFDLWNVRKWMRDQLLVFFADEPDIMAKLKDPALVDPGEYGMENYNCRIFACFLFTLTEVQSGLKIWEVIMILWIIPTKADSWIQWRSDGNILDPMDALRFKTAGMPLGWKIFNFLLVVLPKIFLLCQVYWMGFRFLMDTAGMLDLVLGAMAMDFILTFDELILESFDSAITKQIMSQLEDYEVDEDQTDDFGDMSRSQGFKAVMKAIWLGTPRRLILVVGVLVFFVQLYYHVHCETGKRTGAWVSKPTKLPVTTQYTFKNLITNFVDFEKDKTTGEPIWAWKSTPVHEEA